MKQLWIDVKTFFKGVKFVNSVEPFLIQTLLIEKSTNALPPFVNLSLIHI